MKDPAGGPPGDRYREAHKALARWEAIEPERCRAVMVERQRTYRLRLESGEVQVGLEQEHVWTL